jgi:TonB family protein
MSNKMRFASIVLAGVMVAPAGLLVAQSREPGGVPEQNDPMGGPPVVVPGPRGPVRISGGVMAGQLLTKVNPVYPAEARANGVQGTVVLHAIIGRHGSVEKLTVVSGPDALQAAALDAVRQWTYKPYLLNGQPVEVDTTIVVNLNLAPRPM